MTGDELCVLAMQAFENTNYRVCVQYLINVFEQGENREEILDFLYQNFINPNDQEFRASYGKNSSCLDEIEYEDLTLDFIPVSDKIFYIFDKEEQCFWGELNLEDDAIITEKLEDPFNGYVFADIWDVRGILPFIKAGSRSQTFYLITEDSRRTASFGKIPELTDIFQGSLVVLYNINAFKIFFINNPDIYLPKLAVAGDKLPSLQNLLNELHKRRITDLDGKRENILLSVCIPSYNRGEQALQNVTHLLGLCYDSEIEIILSNNGSTENNEGYEKIKEIKDSRLKYHEFPKNAGFSGNILQVLSMAKGRYAVFCSDEDFMILENLPYYLKILQEPQIKGVIHSSGREGGKNMDKHPGVFERLIGGKIEELFFASGLNYLTGTFLSIEALKKQNVLELVRKNSSNSFVIHYPHNTVAMMLAYYYGAYFCGIELWEEGDGDDPGEYPAYVTIETRKKHFESFMALVQDILPISGQELIDLYLKHGERMLELVEVGRYYFPQYYEENGYTSEIVKRKIYEICREDITLIQKNISHQETEYLNLIYLNKLAGTAST